MKIDYPVINKEDVQPGDIVLAQWQQNEGVTYFEWTVEDPVNLVYGEATYYLIDRPKPVFPEDYGSIIIAKRVRGTSFPDGVVLTRQRGPSTAYSMNRPLWKSLGCKIEGADNHPESQIHDWVLAKVVPAE